MGMEAAIPQQEVIPKVEIPPVGNFRVEAFNLKGNSEPTWGDRIAFQPDQVGVGSILHSSDGTAYVFLAEDPGKPNKKDTWNASVVLNPHDRNYGKSSTVEVFFNSTDKKLLTRDENGYVVDVSDSENVTLQVLEEKPIESPEQDESKRSGILKKLDEFAKQASDLAREKKDFYSKRLPIFLLATTVFMTPVVANVMNIGYGADFTSLSSFATSTAEILSRSPDTLIRLDSLMPLSGLVAYLNGFKAANHMENEIKNVAKLKSTLTNTWQQMLSVRMARKMGVDSSQLNLDNLIVKGK